ncbi:MAG: cyanophycin synthetase, partial [Bowdeniella nasicola]|nr:cyanophycin synthetase [Bowdeniella nasicola]
HLDWHGSYRSYQSAKARIHERTQRACLYSRHDEATRHMVERADVIAGARAISVGIDIPPVAGIGFAEDLLIDRAYLPTRAHEAAALASLDALSAFATDGHIPPHIRLDAAFAAGMARAMDIDPSAVADGLHSYRPGAHRAEAIANIDGVRYINDSKATNAHAARASLAAHADHSVVWIAGGLAKGASFDTLVAEMEDKLKAAVIIGVDHEPFRRAFRQSPHLPVRYIDPDDANPLHTAVTTAQQLADRGDVVLLAPACASMDQFANYAVRGQEFAAAVRQLTP